MKVYDLYSNELNKHILNTDVLEPLHLLKCLLQNCPSCLHKYLFILQSLICLLNVSWSFKLYLYWPVRFVTWLFWQQLVHNTLKKEKIIPNTYSGLLSTSSAISHWALSWLYFGCFSSFTAVINLLLYCIWFYMWNML